MHKQGCENERAPTIFIKEFRIICIRDRVAVDYVV